MSDFQPLVESNRRLTETVENKVGEIDAATEQMRKDFETFMSDRERIGNGEPGSRRLNIYQNVLYQGYDHVPDSEKPEGWVDNNANLYLHFKTKFNTITKNGMFHFRIQGYAYGQAAIIDETLAGYSYTTSNQVINIGTFGSHEPTVYRAPNGDVYLRLKATNLYYWSFYVDTMNASGGLPNKGDVELIVSPNATLNNY